MKFKEGRVNRKIIIIIIEKCRVLQEKKTSKGIGRV